MLGGSQGVKGKPLVRLPPLAHLPRTLGGGPAENRSPPVVTHTSQVFPGHVQSRIIAQAHPAECIENLNARCVPASLALQKLNMMISQLAEMCGLKGIVLTGVFDDAQAVGFGMLSESIEVTDEDIKVLGEAAASQSDMFKDAMRKKRNIQFPSDSKIVSASGGVLPVVK